MTKKRAVFIDNNVWDSFFGNDLCLCHYLPPDKYSLYINREVSFEISAIPEHKQELRKFINKCIDCCIKERAIFGFHNPAFPLNEQRVGNFDNGIFAAPEAEKFRKELCDEFYGKQREKLKAIKSSTKLYAKETDIDLAVRSMHSIVLTYDRSKNKSKGKNKGKKGIQNTPLNYAHQKKYNVVFLNDFNIQTDSLESYIFDQLKANSLSPHQ